MRQLISPSRLIFEVGSSPAELAREVTGVIINVVSQKPEALLLLPTGQTPLVVYAELRQRAASGGLDFSRVRIAALDEYVSVDPMAPQSFRSFLRREVSEPLAMSELQLLSPNGLATDPDREASAYEKLLEELGPPDLALLGVGTNGHVAFNEPGTPWTIKTHVSALAQETRLANRSSFGDNSGAVPPNAITVGLATLAQARHTVLLAMGNPKAGALAPLWWGERTMSSPVSSLMDHPHLRVFIDEDLAEAL